jgi:hypothetical protein
MTLEAGRKSSTPSKSMPASLSGFSSLSRPPRKPPSRQTGRRPEPPIGKPAVAKRIVDVFLQDRLIASYPFVWREFRTPTPDSEFIDRAREIMRNRGFAQAEIAGAKFLVSSAQKNQAV